MAETLTLGDPPLTLAVRRNARARRLTLRVAPAGGASLTAPPHVSLAELSRFAEAREAWLRGRIAAKPAEITVAPGTTVLLRGEAVTLRAIDGRSVRREGAALLIPRRNFAARAQAHLREEARAALTEAASRYATALGARYSAISIRDTRSRWGSCSSKGGLSFSWRLVMAPREALDYVAAHEVAHLREMNHGEGFWALVERLYPRWQAQRDWLRSEGATLHRYRFET